MTAVEAPQARALVVGVSQTAFGNGALATLAGVESDVHAVSHMLERRGFRVSVPQGSELSAERVGAALADLIAATGPSDLAVIYLTGHGYRTKDLDGDEGDEWDEAFVCADRPILDDWFRDALWPRVRSGAKIVAVVDACHSDTIVAGVIAPPEAPPPTTRLTSIDGYYRLILSACRDKETTIDLGGGDFGSGVVTRAMLQALRDWQPSYRSLWSAVVSNVHHDDSLGIGTPQYSSYGPNDDLLDAMAFEPPA